MWYKKCDAVGQLCNVKIKYGNGYKLVGKTIRWYIKLSESDGA